DGKDLAEECSQRKAGRAGHSTPHRGSLPDRRSACARAMVLQLAAGICPGFGRSRNPPTKIGSNILAGKSTLGAGLPLRPSDWRIARATDAGGLADIAGNVKQE